MRHRIFIAVNLPENLKSELARYRSKWPDLPAKWTKPENIHITLEFLGYVPEQEIPEICKAAEEAARNQKAFSLKIVKISYGPPKKMPPRMVWAIGEKSTELSYLKESLQNNLQGSRIGYSPEKRSFSPHITLARIRTWEWRRLEIEERPPVEENLDLEFDVDSLEIMESKLKKGGAEYQVLESCRLKK